MLRRRHHSLIFAMGLGFGPGSALGCGGADKGDASAANPKKVDAPTPERGEEAEVPKMNLAGPMAKAAAAEKKVQGEAAHAFAPGTTAPELSLPTADGGRFALQEALAKGPAVVVFYRGDWCPVCKKQLSELEAATAQFEAKGATVVAVSVDDADKSDAFAKATGAKFDILVDTKREAIEAWHVEHPGETFAKPATFVVGKDGKILFAHVGSDARDRPAVADILAAL